MTNILKKPFRYAESKLWDYYGYRDAKFLTQKYPELRAYETLCRVELSKIRPEYESYITQISTVGHAVSWEAVQLLFVLAKSIKPKRILDLGSGFSSFALRHFSTYVQNGVEIYSVDDNEEWLQKTYGFLKSHDLPTDNLFLWPDFKLSDQDDFDLIFHDLGRMELRVESLPFVLSLQSPAGIVVLDDMHKKPYRTMIKQEIENKNLSLHSARKFTLDKFGRFSQIAIR
jgi:predicted O-methyltransferase YrrM